MTSKLPQVAIIGRANVGKSTLFNKLCEEKKAIVSSIPGTTRDRNFAKINWNGALFELVDTGGVDIVHDKAFEEDVIKQAKVALAEADLVLFLVDAKDGLMPQDKAVAGLLKKARKPVILVANKADSPRLKRQVEDFYKLGLNEPLPVSALNGSGTGDLLDLAVKSLKPGPQIIEPEDQAIKIAVIGRPNVGKSSIINAILGEERVIVSPTPYTTRDSQGIELTYQE
ncbi:MAG TPA: GTPase, partial [Patescibacteria group bacterium]|nr:GTPase [Patescibacteria group bacterium]